MELPRLSLKAVIALGIALLADFLQLVLFPFFFEGGFSPLDDGLDFGVAATMTALLGWHWVFLPTALFELAPGVDLAPFWTGAALFVIFGRSQPQIEGKPGDKLLTQVVKGPLGILQK